MGTTVKVKVSKTLTATQKNMAYVLNGKFNQIGLDIYHGTRNHTPTSRGDIQGMRTQLRSMQTRLIQLMTELETAIPEEDV